MPYISPDERPPIDEAVSVVAEHLVLQLVNELNGDTELSLCYRETILRVAQTLERLQGGITFQSENSVVDNLAELIFNGRNEQYRGAWSGRLNYAITRLIQLVPVKLVEGGAWKEEFRYWIYAQTVGALESCKLEIFKHEQNWVSDLLIGVLTDVKDEYKRRVNTAYETFQILKSGDCYTTKYHTDLITVRDDSGRAVGYQEIVRSLPN